MAPRMKIETDAGGTTTSEVTPQPSVSAPQVQAPKVKAQAPKAQIAAVETADAREPKPAASVTASPAPASVVKPAVKETATAAPAAKAAATSSRPHVTVAPVVETNAQDEVDGSFEFADDGVRERATSGNAANATVANATAADANAAGAQTPRTKLDITGWVRRTFPGHVHAFWGAVLAIVVALLTFAIGLPRMLVIAILVVIGIALGQVLDGDPKIIRTIRDLFSGDREQ